MPVCPPLPDSDLAKLSRAIPNTFMFGATCANEAAAGSAKGDQYCLSDKVFWTIVVPWDQFLSEGWVAPGGNKYWSRSIPANPSDPAASAVLRLLAERSRRKFKDVFYKSKTLMKDIIPRYVGIFEPTFGVLSIGLEFDPNETVSNFVKRGGYLFWVGKGGSGNPFDGSRIQSYWSEWMTNMVTSAQLWAAYNPKENVITYTIRLEYRDGLGKAIQSIVNTTRKYTEKFCTKITSPEAAIAAGAVTPIPGSQPFVAAWAATATLCSWPPAQCTPAETTKTMSIGPLIKLPPAPKFANLQLFTPSWKSQHTASSAGNAPTQMTVLAPLKSLTVPPSIDDLKVPIEGLKWHQTPTTKAAASVGVIALIGGLAAGLFARN